MKKATGMKKLMEKASAGVSAEELKNVCYDSFCQEENDYFITLHEADVAYKREEGRDNVFRQAV